MKQSQVARLIRALILAVLIIPLVAATIFTTLSALTVSPGLIGANGNATGTVERTTVAANQIVNLTSADPTVAIVPNRVTIYSKSRSATFPITGGSKGGCTWIKAQSGTAPAKQARIMVGPPGTPSQHPVKLALGSGQTLSMNTLTWIVGLQVAASVTLENPAGQYGAIVTLSSSNPSVATVPPSLRLLPGTSRRSFTITPTSTGCAVISASFGTAVSSKMLNVVTPEG